MPECVLIAWESIYIYIAFEASDLKQLNSRHIVKIPRKPESPRHMSEFASIPRMFRQPFTGNPSPQCKTSASDRLLASGFKLRHRGETRQDLANTLT